MKRTLCILFLTAVSFLPSMAQTVNGVPLKEIDVEHIQIVGVSKMMSSKVTIHIDFGQRNKAFNNKDTEIRDENDKAVEFNSMIDALNFMSANGYEFVQAYAFALGQGPNVYHFLMKRSIKKD